MENNGWPERFDLFPRIARLGRFLGHTLTGPHQLASHGDHTFEHALVELEAREEVLSAGFQEGFDASDRLYREYDEPTQEIPVHYVPLRVEIGGTVVYGADSNFRIDL